MKKCKVIHLITPYLFHTGSWIYTQLIKPEKIDNFVFTFETENLTQFPFQKLFNFDGLTSYKKSAVKIIRKLTDGSYNPFFGAATKSIKPDIFHAHFGFEAVRWLNFVKKYNLPFITTFYGLDVSQLGKLDVWKEKYKKLFNYGTLFLAEGTNLKQQLINLGCNKDKIKIQHLGVDINRYYKGKMINDKIIILQAATFREKKGIEYSLKAISLIAKEHPNIEFRLIGKGDTEEADRKIEKIINELNIKNQVKLLGIKNHQGGY